MTELKKANEAYLITEGGIPKVTTSLTNHYSSNSLFIDRRTIEYTHSSSSSSSSSPSNEIQRAAFLNLGFGDHDVTGVRCDSSSRL